MQTSPIRLLLVEDNPADARLLRELLRELNAPAFDVTCVERLGEAETVLASETFDAVLLDLSLPDARGLESVARAEAAAPATPLIVLTGLDDQNLAVEAVRAGAQEYLVKGEVSGPLLARVVRYSIERKRLEEDRRELLARERKARAEAEAAYDRARRALRQRDEVLGTVAHDLRSPLAGIAVALATMLRNTTNPEAQRVISAMQREAERMNRLIQDLLEVASIEAGRLVVQPRPCDLATLIRESTELLRPIFHDRGLAFEVEIPEDLPPVLADRDRLSRVFSNLLSNAIKFTPRDGRITLTTAREGAAVRISVTDTGPGIPVDERARLFDRFAHPPRPRPGGGTGLGLTIARGIVEAHGGRIEVESEVGTGSTFHVTLPAAVFAVPAV
ncbi:MAG: response regulator [Acidobacteria bacterium]|nr:response regulator [Acidobacteriota bacterium]